MNTKQQFYIYIVKILVFLILQNSAFGQGDLFFPHMGSSLKLTDAKEFNLSLGKFEYNFFGDHDFLPITNSNLQLSYSPKKHIGISLHHSRELSSNWSSWPVFRDYKQTAHQTGFDIGGYYTIKFQLRRHKKRLPPNLARYRKILFDIYSGYSLGQFHRQEVTEPSLSPLPYGRVKLFSQKIYLQGGIHWVGRFIHLSGMLRGGQVNYSKANLNGQIDTQEFNYINTILKAKKTHFFGYSVKLELNYKGIGVYAETLRENSQLLSYDRGPYNNTIFGIAMNIQQIKQIFFTKKKQ